MLIDYVEMQYIPEIKYIILFIIFDIYYIKLTDFFLLKEITCYDNLISFNKKKTVNRNLINLKHSFFYVIE